MGRVREGWYEREEIQKVTLDWIKINCKLTNREKELLQIVYDRKLVRRDHLEIISPSFRKLGNNRTVLLNRSIKKMYKKMIFDKVHEQQELGKGSNPAILALDKAGSLILGKPHKRRIIHKRTTMKGQYYVRRNLPSSFKHINGINQVEVETISFCEQCGYEISMWQLEQPKVFSYNEERIALIPDVLVILKIGEKYLAVFIEYDTGSEGLREKEPRIIREKIVKYKRYKSSSLWKDEEWQKYFSQHMFPLLLFVTEDEKRIEFVNRLTKEMGVKGLALYHENYVSVLKKLIEVVNKQ